MDQDEAHAFDRNRSDNPHRWYRVTRSHATRVIHLLLLLTVMHQLIGSWFIERPLPGKPAAWPFVLHEYVGLTGLALMAVFWVWILLRRGEAGLGRLLPWLSRAGAGAVAGDVSTQLRRVLAGKPPDEGTGALASAIHGLGLLTVTAMTITGTLYFLSDGAAAAQGFLRLHKLLANLMWAYLIGHAGLAVAHHLLGHPVFSRMFWAVRR